MSRWLSIDPGERYWGVAVGAPDTGSIQPLTILPARDRERLTRDLARLIKDYHVTRIIFGIPLKQGRWGMTAERLFPLIQFVIHRLAIHDIYFFDETATTPPVRGKKRRDDLAAARLLSRALHARERLMAPADIRKIRQVWLDHRGAVHQQKAGKISPGEGAL